MTIQTIIEQELDRIHGGYTSYIDTDRDKIEKTINIIISTLLDEIEINVKEFKLSTTYTDIEKNQISQDAYYKAVEQVLSALNKYRI